MSRIVPRGRTAYASVNTARSVVSSVCAGQAAGRHVVVRRHVAPLLSSRPRGSASRSTVAVQPGLPDRAGERTPGVRRHRVLVPQPGRRRPRTPRRGRRRTRSASAADRDLALVAPGPTRRAGRGGHPARRRRRARCRGRGRSVQTAGSPSWSDAMPPQASAKSPLSRRLSSAVQGEWSLTTKSMSPSTSPSQRRVPVVGVADRRAALELRGAVGDLVGVEDEVVRAGLDGHVDALGAGRARARGSRRRRLRCTTWARPPVSRAASMTRSIARSSAAGGRDARKPAYAGPCGARRSMASASSACTIISAPSRAVSAIACAEARRRSRCGNSSTPESSRKHLKPKTPASCSGAQVGEVARAPRRPRTRRRRTPGRAAAARFSSSAATVVVGGMLLSGMSTIVVTPPAAAARVAVAKPSHSVRPGSLTWTWVSTRPGSSTSSSASSTHEVGVGAGGVRREVDDDAVLDADLDRLLAARRRPPAVRGSGRRAGRSPQLPR